MTKNEPLDPVDWKILAELQNDASDHQQGVGRSSRLGDVLVPRARTTPTRQRHDQRHRMRLSIRQPLAGSMQAIIAVQLRPHRRDLVDRFTADALALPETLALFNVSGPEDFFLHVAVRDSAHLQRVLIDHLGRTSRGLARPNAPSSTAKRSPHPSDRTGKSGLERVGQNH